MPPLGYQLHRFDLANGLTLVVNPDATAPGVAVNLWYRVGSADEAPGRTGFAHLFEHLMFAGTTSGVAAGEHLAAMQAAGGHANATTSFDRTNYFETVQPGALDLALWLEAERMARLRLDQDTLDTQRDVVTEERHQRYDNVPYGDTLELLMALHHPHGHPYAHTPIGSMAELAASSLDEVAAFHRHWYTPANAVLVLAGAVAPDDALVRVERQFAELHSPARPDPVPVPDLGPHAAPTRLEVVRDVPRDALHLGWRIPPEQHPDARALSLALAVLADGMTSRLHRRLVRDTEVADGVSGTTMGLTRGDNLALLSARVREGADPAAVDQAMVDEATRLAVEGPTPAELGRVVAQHEREWLSELADLESRADQINSHTVVEDDPDRINTELDEVRALTPDDITRVTRQWLAPEALATLQYRGEAS